MKPLHSLLWLTIAVLMLLPTKGLGRFPETSTGPPAPGALGLGSWLMPREVSTLIPESRGSSVDERRYHCPKQRSGSVEGMRALPPQVTMWLLEEGDSPSPFPARV